MGTILSIIVTCVCLFGAIASAQVDRSAVWTGGEGAYKVYRIPAAVATTKGTLLVFCEGRQAKGDSGRIDLLVKRSSDGGKTFGQSEIVWSDGKNTCGNPCPVVDQSTGTIWLLMTQNLGEDSEREIVHEGAKQRTVWVTSSEDDGKTWGAPREITQDVSKPQWAWYATGPGVGIQLKQGPHAGRMVIPCDHTIRGGGKNSGNSHIIYSDDQGKTWKLGGQAPEMRFNECQIAELSDGLLMLNMRNVRPPASTQRGVCISDDGGEMFKELYHDAALPEPVCQGSILAVKGALLFSNPASDSKRENMTVRVSRDDGRTWAASKQVFAGPSAYSCLVQLPDGAIGLLYECGEKSSIDRIEFARFALESLSANP